MLNHTKIPPTMSYLEPMQDCARVGLVGSLLKIMKMVELSCFCVLFAF